MTPWRSPGRRRSAQGRAQNRGFGGHHRLDRAAQGRARPRPGGQGGRAHAPQGCRPPAPGARRVERLAGRRSAQASASRSCRPTWRGSRCSRPSPARCCTSPTGRATRKRSETTRGAPRKSSRSVWLAHMKAEGEVDEIDSSRIAVGQPVRLSLDANADVELAGELVSLRRLREAACAQQSAQGGRGRALAGRSAEVELRPGHAVRGEIEVARLPDVLIIPLDAVEATPDGAVVYRDCAGSPRCGRARPPHARRGRGPQRPGGGRSAAPGRCGERRAGARRISRWLRALLALALLGALVAGAATLVPTRDDDTALPTYRVVRAAFHRAIPAEGDLSRRGHAHQAPRDARACR